jgi:hypothetical protein
MATLFGVAILAYQLILKNLFICYLLLIDCPLLKNIS